MGYVDGMNLARAYIVLSGLDPSGLAAVRNVSQCIISCENDCGDRRYWPSPWNPWFVGCVVGCRSGCNGEDFNLGSYIHYSMSDQYKTRLTCLCGLVEGGDLLLPPNAPLAVLDCACEIFTNIVNRHADPNAPASHLLTIIQATDCQLDLLGIGGRFRGNVVEILDRIAIIIEESYQWGNPKLDCSIEACIKAFGR